ncbi:MAG: diaminopimelate epimerase [Bacteroidetes bacterium]|nr:diaminopimelate epimerase [Bacteroidota bacterium]
MHFYKYQGAGNDFILLDNRSGQLQLNTSQIRKLCDRRLGIGADGLMLLNTSNEADFQMTYFNADGKPGSLCGNGSRCIIRFAHDLGIRKTNYDFIASDGPHQAEILADGNIRLQMHDVSQIEVADQGFFLNTGSPHLVQLVTQLDSLDVHTIGNAIRHHPRFAPGGTNVNFMERTNQPGHVRVRTFERGVEAETLSCGTGVTACALVLAQTDQIIRETYIHTRGGDLQVSYQTKDFEQFREISLIGPAEKVFEAEMDVK